MNIVFVVVTVSFAVVSIIANLSPLINTIVTKRSEEKRMWFENYFSAKERSYTAFADAAADCRQNPTNEAVDKLYSACVCAAFLSGEETGKTLSALASALIEDERDNRAISMLQAEAIGRMREELKDPSKQKPSQHRKQCCKKLS